MRVRDEGGLEGSVGEVGLVLEVDAPLVGRRKSLARSKLGGPGGSDSMRGCEDALANYLSSQVNSALRKTWKHIEKRRKGKSKSPSRDHLHLLLHQHTVVFES